MCIKTFLDLAGPKILQNQTAMRYVVLDLLDYLLRCRRISTIQKLFHSYECMTTLDNKYFFSIANKINWIKFYSAFNIEWSRKVVYWISYYRTNKFKGDKRMESVQDCGIAKKYYALLFTYGNRYNLINLYCIWYNINLCKSKYIHEYFYNVCIY